MAETLASGASHHGTGSTSVQSTGIKPAEQAAPKDMATPGRSSTTHPQLDMPH